MRYFYSFLFYLALPFILLRLLWRSRLLPAYRKGLLSRLAYAYPLPLKQSIWIHAVSLGEALSAIPLIKALQKKYPHLPILVTTTTPTGAASIKTILGDTITHTYLPYDLPFAVKRFLRQFCPVIGIIMETELWPNLFAACSAKKIPLCIMNARLSPRSAKAYRAISSLTTKMLQSVHVIAAQSEIDAGRFLKIGACPEKIIVAGNIKFDVDLSNDWVEKGFSLRQSFGGDRFIWIAASTHEKEEEMILSAHRSICQINPKALLILVPRHPDRFQKVAELCSSFVMSRHSQRGLENTSQTIYLGDTIGELPLFYAAADVAFVGGSLIPHGGHNILEPALLSKAVLSGPHYFNFMEICESFIKKNALTIVRDTKDLTAVLLAYMQDRARCVEMGKHAQKIALSNRGALDRQLALVEQVLASTG